MESGASLGELSESGSPRTKWVDHGIEGSVMNSRANLETEDHLGPTPSEDVSLHADFECRFYLLTAVLPHIHAAS